MKAIKHHQNKTLFNKNTSRQEVKNNKHAHRRDIKARDKAQIKEQRELHTSYPNLYQQEGSLGFLGCAIINVGCSLAYPGLAVARYVCDHPLLAAGVMLLTCVTHSVAGPIRAARHVVQAAQDYQNPDSNTQDSNSNSCFEAGCTNLHAEPQPAPKVSSAIHLDSFQTAAIDFDNTEAIFPVLMDFTNQTCRDTVLQDILNTTQTSSLDPISSPSADPTFNGQLRWTSRSGATASAIMDLDSSGLSLAVGTSVTQFDCVTGISIETMNLTSTRQTIQHQAAMRHATQQINQVVNAVDGRSPDEACVMLKETNSSKAGIAIRQCLPILKSLPPLEENQAGHTDLSSSATQKLLCAKLISLVSDGIPEGNSNISASVSSTLNFGTPSLLSNDTISSINVTQGASPLQSNETAASALAFSLLRRCPALKIQDVRAAIHVGGTKLPAGSVLPAQHLVQALDFIASENDGETPESVVVYEGVEVAGYHTDVSALAKLVGDLKSKGITVYAYASSKGSWLSRVPGIVVTDRVSQLVLTNRELPTPIQQNQLGTSSAIAVSIGALLTAIGLGFCLKIRNKNNIAAKRAQERQVREEESQEMQPLFQTEEELNPSTTQDNIPLLDADSIRAIDSSVTDLTIDDLYPRAHGASPEEDAQTTAQIISQREQDNARKIETGIAAEMARREAIKTRSTSIIKVKND